jgi:hypothetical protein
MGTLVSKHFTIPKDRRFQNALDNDKDHIVPGSNGDHVLRIQTALETLTAVDLGMERGDYGSNTEDAVRAYKNDESRKILQSYQTTADPIVGKRTMKSLDQEMHLFEIRKKGGGLVIPKPKVKPKPKNMSGTELAHLDVPLAIKKVNAAIARMAEYESTLSLRLGPIVIFRPFNKVTEDALSVHFKLLDFETTGVILPRRAITMPDVTHILDHFRKILAHLVGHAANFTDGHPVDKFGKPVAAAAPLNSNNSIFSPLFRNFSTKDGAAIGPNSRAAILVHEGFHAVDASLSSGRDDIHISEFLPEYETQDTAHALFNPSAFASFAAHAFKGSDPNPRFGLGPGRPL